VDDLLVASERGGFPITYDELIECVAKRTTRSDFHSMTPAISSGQNQGHSVEIDLQLAEQEPPDVLYHGTVERFLAPIMTEG